MKGRHTYPHVKEYLLPEYQMVVEGLMPFPSAERSQEAADLCTNLQRIIPQAVEKIWEAVRWSRKNPKPKGWVSAWDYLEQEMHVFWPTASHSWTRKEKADWEHRAFCAVISLALDIAKTDVKYWGVDDPEKQSYCSYCKRPQPIEHFTRSLFTCDTCFAKREGGYQG
jgi:hypothetical protein